MYPLQYALPVAVVLVLLQTDTSIEFFVIFFGIHFIFSLSICVCSFAIWRLFIMYRKSKQFMGIRWHDGLGTHLTMVIDGDKTVLLPNKNSISVHIIYFKIDWSKEERRRSPKKKKFEFIRFGDTWSLFLKREKRDLIDRQFKYYMFLVP